MEIDRIPGATMDIGKPANWDEEKNGPCGTLPVRREEHDGTFFAVSQWKPSAEDLAVLNAGGTLRLGVSAPVHPVVFLGVASKEDSYGGDPKAPIEDVVDGEDAEPVLDVATDTYTWGVGGEPVGPMELHELGLCDEETCDQCEFDEEDK